RSLITLKALTYAETGGIVAAPTTSLPEALGGTRNWDYRYCWLRDASLTLRTLLDNGLVEEAHGWREWLVRAVAGCPSQLQVAYGVDGSRRLPEYEIRHLPGYARSRPVRVGNAASDQFQLDVYGEVIDALDLARRKGLPQPVGLASLQRLLLDHLCLAWHNPDEGIWELRAERRHHVYSKVMAWSAFDRAGRAASAGLIRGPVERWASNAAAIRAEVLDLGWSDEKRSFTAAYGSDDLDASLLLIGQTGFLAPDDPRIVSTIEAIERELVVDGLVTRYRTDAGTDGIEGGEGAFLACSFWLVDALVGIGRREDAQRLFDHLLDLRNDLGLLAEEYDVIARRQVGNFPQAFSHLQLARSAGILASASAELLDVDAVG
ncbi:MAG: glycoside hydrolase family 15 protein, partial [Actinobacteria bacterium]|nr:glycoside hydrolase family 15 protein [Actinomycetota bacterium]